MEIDTFLLIIITVVIFIILFIQIYVIYYINPLLIIGQEIKDHNYQSIRPLAVDVVRNVVIPETKTIIKEEFESTSSAIKKSIDNAVATIKSLIELLCKKPT
ncbi:MAG: hypothetical protein Edafosvirus15_9 [Edafosvirus sp.]|uniref:Uncharacterized protein n=1 Tax=Edafosvirus sp. TaxID=2487765 RepID=A0A3G4ZUB1_9VIRU|nr:MAG: hypothetical protein Edafosvirus15_9 [Edafosvirus sp.]